MKPNTIAKKRIALLTLALLLSTFALSWWMVPKPEDIRRSALGSDRILLSADGQLLQTLRTDFSRRRLAWSPLANFPLNLTQAVILAEDQRFYSHPGFDWHGLGRAFLADLRGQKVQGASTITMQLSDLMSDEVLLEHKSIVKGSVLHKALQVGRALIIEMKWSKKQILEAYLNLIHLRGEYEGVPAFSQAFLGKASEALDPSESVVVAVMISSPNQNAKSLRQRSCALHQRLNPSDDCIRVDQAVEKIFASTPHLPASPGMAPHLARRLFNLYPDQAVITSTLDLELQQKLSSIMEKNLFHLKNQNVNDSAAIVIDNQTGEIKAYVGAVSTSQSPHVDGVIAYRQAGSTLKPFLYGKGFETKTLTPASILLDDPTAISWGNDVYRPANYDRHFNGPVTVREALASSLNVPAVKTVTIIGLHEAYHTLQSIGLTGLKEPDFYGVSLALGAVEVRLEDLANAYRMLANGGEWSELKSIENQKQDKKPVRVFSKGTSFLVSSILSDPSARAIGFGADSPLETPFWSAVKTGTSKDYRDNWCVGFSEKYTVAVWAGNFDAQAMQKVSGVTGAGPTWYEIMNVLHDHLPSHPPQIPSDVVKMQIRHQWASQLKTEYFLKGTEPNQAVIEPSPEKRVQFVFPAEGSILVKDPHMDQNHVALFIRFKGLVPEQSRLLWDGQPLGPALSPFKVERPQVGKHELSILTSDGKLLSRVGFMIRGGLN